MACSLQNINEMPPEIHTMEKCCFLKPVGLIHSQIIKFSVEHGIFYISFLSGYKTTCFSCYKGSPDSSVG